MFFSKAIYKVPKPKKRTTLWIDFFENFLKICVTISIVLIIWSFWVLDQSENRSFQRTRRKSYNENDVRSYEDVFVYKKDMERHGLGEGGVPVNITGLDSTEVERAYRTYAYNSLVSEKISLNRSVPDLRHPECKKMKYLSHLPSVSVIIPFNNEHWTVILRTCYSIINRSPPELIKEIILVNDASTVEMLNTDLPAFISKYLPKVRIIRLEERSGLIVARLIGSKQATADVLLFVDAHVEAGYNWLPPLLDPIVKDPKTCVCPHLDVIQFETFKFFPIDHGGRGVFDWHFNYVRLPVLNDEAKELPKPFRNPVMWGGLFAISRKFFWELGGYDEQLDIWGGEQYELSFKIWMCGGQLLDAVCSRFGHVYPKPGKYDVNPRKKDYLHKNFKRVAEVWMDEYKEYIYARNPEVYNATNPGDLTKQKALRKKLQCKSFKWYMENIAPDLISYLPAVYPPDYASGTIRSDASHNLCLDTLGNIRHHPIGLFHCAEDSVNPYYNQRWSLSAYNDLRIKNEEHCIDVFHKGRNARVYLYDCHRGGGNQFWQYHLEKKWLVHGDVGRKCLEADIIRKRVVVNVCDPYNPRMRWTFGVMNVTALMSQRIYTGDNTKLNILDDVPKQIKMPI